MTKFHVQNQGLGSGLKASRKLAKFTQSQLADTAGVHRNALLAVEAGRGSVATINLIASALGFEVSGRGLSGDGTLQERLTSLRKRRRLSRRAVASLAGISVPAVDALERTGGGHVSTLEAIGRAIGAGLCLVPKGTSIGFWESAATSSADVEWYTPRWLLDRVSTVVGPFDCDPCSPGRGKSEVQARLHFTVADDGLSHSWPGTVWLNPPYGSAIGQWLGKAREEMAAGFAKKVVALIPARTDTRWWHDHAAGKADIIMLRGRVAFIGGGPAPFPSALVGYGLTEGERDRLFEAFPDAWHVRKVRFQTSEALADAAD